LILCFVRDRKGQEETPLIDCISKLIERQAAAITKLNGIEFDRAQTKEDAATVEETSEEGRRAHETATKFLFGTSLEPNLHRSRSDRWETFEPEGLSFLDFSVRYHRLRRKDFSESEYSDEVLLPGIHNSGIVKFKRGAAAKIAEVELDQTRLEKLRKACSSVLASFKAPYRPGLAFTDLSKLVDQNAHEHLATIFRINLNSRLLYDQVYLEEDEIQLFYQDFRRATPTGFTLFEKFGSELILRLSIFS
jgi:hypothetical protein